MQHHASLSAFCAASSVRWETHDDANASRHSRVSAVPGVQRQLAISGMSSPCSRM